MRSKRSVKRWVGDFCVSASLTMRTTLASVLSLASRVTSTSIAPLPLIVVFAEMILVVVKPF